MAVQATDVFVLSRGTTLYKAAASVLASYITGIGTYKANIGNGSATAITVTHNLGTTDVMVELFAIAGDKVTRIPKVERPTVNTVRLTFETAPTTNQYRVLIRAI